MIKLRVGVMAGIAAFLTLAAVAAAREEYPPPVDRSASAEARQKQKDGQTELATARTTLTQTAQKLRTDFEKSPEWLAAQDQLKAAQSDFDAARKPVLEGLMSNPDYKAAKLAKEKADADKESLRANGGSPDELIAAATKSMETGAAVSKFETDALAADAKTVEARKKLVDANAAVAALKKKFDQSVQSDPAWVAAKKDIDTAQEKIATAAKDLTAANIKEVQAEKARQQQMKEVDRRNAQADYQTRQQQQQQRNRN